jgi:hypothetical protein
MTLVSTNVLRITQVFMRLYHTAVAYLFLRTAILPSKRTLRRVLQYDTSLCCPFTRPSHSLHIPPKRMSGVAFIFPETAASFDSTNLPAFASLADSITRIQIFHTANIVTATGHYLEPVHNLTDTSYSSVFIILSFHLFLRCFPLPKL